MVGVALSYLPFLIVLSVMIVFMFFLLPGSFFLLSPKQLFSSETRNRPASIIVEDLRLRSASLSVGRF